MQSVQLELWGGGGEDPGWNLELSPPVSRHCTALKPYIDRLESHLLMNCLWQARIQEVNTWIKNRGKLAKGFYAQQLLNRIFEIPLYLDL